MAETTSRHNRGVRSRDVLFLGAATATGMAAYGALVEADRIVVERKNLRLPGWPKRLRGFKLALLGDFHINKPHERDRALRAVNMALDELPDMVAMIGDYVGKWNLENPAYLGDALEPLLQMEGRVVAVPGNHDYDDGDASLLAPIFEWLNIKLLRNQAWSCQGITWIGVDSANWGMARPEIAQAEARNLDKDDPQIVLFHEPDMVRLIEPGPVLQLSGHSHGGQFRFPGGFTPMHTENGRRYVRGWHPEAPIPLYVTRGVGTTMLPIRFLCPPEVTILTLLGEEAG